MTTESDITAGAAAERRTADQVAKVGFRDVFAVSEFRALWTAQLASVVGDQLARVALTVLVYARTNSSLLAAVTFVASIIPMFIGSLLLGGLADRFPQRAVMIVCDLLRCALVVVMIVPGVPVPALVGLLFVVTLVNALFATARSALLPDILDGERYVLGQTITLSTFQFAQVVGFGVGGAVVGFLGTGPSLTADAATFAFSALVAWIWVRPRPAPSREDPPGREAGESAAAAPGTLAAETLAAETLAPETPASETLAPETPASGFRGAARMVFATPALLLPMLFGWLTAFYNAPEGVAAPLATSLGGGAVMVGVILAAEVLGEVVGMTIFGRLVPPGARNRWMGPMSVGACAVLALFALPPSLAVALPVLFVSGLCGSYQIAASAAFVSALPRHVRGTAFGLAQGGMSLGQGVVMTAAGAAAGAFAPAWVITVIGIIGACCALIVAVSWARTGGKEPRRRPA